MINTKDVKEYFSRHFLGLVKVHSEPVDMARPRAYSMKRAVEVRSPDVSQKRAVEVLQSSIQGEVKVNGAELIASRGVSCSSVDFRFVTQVLNVHEAVIKKYAVGQVKLRGFPKLAVKPRSGIKRMILLPQERASRLQWLLSRPPRKEGEVVLAWFGPIVENAVSKLTLNKQRGTLLIWYNPQSRHFGAKGLYLCRRLGLKENLEWRWA